MSLSSWSGTEPQSLDLPSSDDLEPSGLTIYEDGSGHTWLFLASDDGRLLKGKLHSDPSKTDWYGPYPAEKRSKKSKNYEGITLAAGMLVVGVEGGAKDGSGGFTLPVLREYDPRPAEASDVATYRHVKWSLPVPDMTSSGMEAMTFIPSGQCPLSWGAPEGELGGLFIMALQGDPGTAYVFEAAAGNASATLKQTLSLPGPSAHSGSKTPLVSDFFHDSGSGYLWVLYDGGTSRDYLQTIKLDSDGTLSEHRSLKAPDDWVGCEGLAVLGSDVLIAIDHKSRRNNGVYVLRGFARNLI